jgi:hypothetical protein
MTHDELVDRGRSWLRRQGCAIVLAEFAANVYTGEQPDVLGWRDGLSLLVECKTSRSDFLADRRKKFRSQPDTGMGDWRFYLTPPGIVNVADLPPGWGLLWAHPRKIERVHGGPFGNSSWHAQRPFVANYAVERMMLVSALRRLQLHHGTAELDLLVHATYLSKKEALATVQNETPLDAGMRVSEGENGGVVDTPEWQGAIDAVNSWARQNR